MIRWIGCSRSLEYAYKADLNANGAREAALAEASHGAAMIVLPAMAYIRIGWILPPWFALAALAVMVWGSLRLFKGAKVSVGWRDPELIAGAGLKIALAVLLFRAIGARQFGDIDPLWNALLSLLGWWLLVTGLTKLFCCCAVFRPRRGRSKISVCRTARRGLQTL